MNDWKTVTGEVKDMLHLKSSIIAVKRLEKKEELDSIKGVERPEGIWTFCMVPHWVRKEGRTIGFTLGDFSDTTEKMGLGTRCMRIQGLAPADESELKYESDTVMSAWLANVDVTMDHMNAYPVPPAAEAIVMAPLEKATFEPDYVMIYADTAQMNYLLNGLQFNDYERYEFYFTGEGSCADALPQVALTGKPALSIPCLGERMRGHVGDGELVLALTTEKLIDGIDGMQGLAGKGITMLQDMPKEMYEQQPKA